MTSILDTIDNAITDHELSADAMRWTLSPSPPDLRPAAYRQQPAARQSTWAWWCPACQKPIPQPRWRRDRRAGFLSGPGQVAYHALDGSLGTHLIERRP